MTRNEAVWINQQVGAMLVTVARSIPTNGSYHGVFMPAARLDSMQKELEKQRTELADFLNAQIEEPRKSTGIRPEEEYGPPGPGGG